eukprot:TRINITY_DN7039_c0_g1_i2.p1 TRINITY_DN7039_c0_g1~~TRINITY_DN7039_c0_g1_i2.p1  ORF type:complete len:952 (-),score=69.11 TRINITY_DN7039_c0_g1_i2:61-2589(-)
MDVREIMKNTVVRAKSSNGTYKFGLMIDRSVLGKWWQLGYSSQALPGIGYTSGTVLARFVDGSLALDEYLGEQNMDLGDNLEKMIKRYLLTTGCRYTFLEFWDHGAGFFGFGGDEASKKKGELSTMTLATMRKSLVTVGEKYTLIGFDACWMSHYEVLSSVGDMAEYILASEEVEPGHGWDYSKYDPSGTAESLGQQIADGFFAHSKTDPRTLSLIRSVEFFAFKREFDALLKDLSDKMLRDAKVRKDVLTARSASSTFKSLFGLPDNVDVGSFLKKMNRVGFDVSGLRTAYKRMFVHQVTTDKKFTGMGMFFPSPLDRGMKIKINCFEFMTRDIPLSEYRTFLWRLFDKQSKHTLIPSPEYETSPCKMDPPKPGLSSRAFSWLGKLFTSTFDFAWDYAWPPLSRLMGFKSTMELLMYPPPKEALSTSLIPWLSNVMVTSTGSMAIFGVSDGAVAKMKLYYGSRLQENDTMLVMGVVTPQWRVTRETMSTHGMLKRAPWPGGEHYGVYANFLPPLQLLQYVKTRDKKNTLKKRQAFVTVVDESHDDFPSTGEARTYTIRVRYFKRPGCKLEGTETAFEGHLIGTLKPPGGVINATMPLKDWSLVIRRENGGAQLPVTVSVDRGVGGGSFQVVQLAFDMKRAGKPEYDPAHMIEKNGATCFEYSCKRGMPFEPTDCPKGEMGEPRFILLMNPIIQYPLTALFQASDADGKVAARAIVAAPTNVRKRFTMNRWGRRWPFTTFPECKHLDVGSCGYLCACWSECHTAFSLGTCDSRVLKKNYEFVRTKTWNPLTWRRMSTSTWDTSDGCGYFQNRNMCLTQRKSDILVADSPNGSTSLDFVSRIM